jgi:hypothetical protein
MSEFLPRLFKVLIFLVNSVTCVFDALFGNKDLASSLGESIVLPDSTLILAT